MAGRSFTDSMPALVFWVSRSGCGPQAARTAPLTKVVVRMESGVHVGPMLVVLLVVLTIGASLVTYLARWGDHRAPVVAAVRALLQLGVVSLVIAAVLRSVWWTLLFVAVMMVTASITAGSRIAQTLRPRAWWACVPVAGGVLPTLALVMVSTAVPWKPISILPIAGILIGGAMTATALAGSRQLDELRVRHGEYEAALGIGLTRREAATLIGGPAAALALVPGLDQTRTVGLVTLPGAFVGVLLGGASPLQAGAAQLLVLVALLQVQAIAAVLTTWVIGGGRLYRSEPLTV